MLLILGIEIYQFSMILEEVHTPCVLTCIVYYCKNAENARNVSWTFYQRLGDAWQLGRALGGGGADTGPGCPGYHAISPGYKSDQQRRN